MWSEPSVRSAPRRTRSVSDDGRIPRTREAQVNDHLIGPGAPAPSPDQQARHAAETHLDRLAVPRGALGRLGDVAAWLSAVQGETPPQPPADIRAVVFAGDHGVASHDVSAYPREVTAAMVRAFLAGDAGVAVLARQNRVRLRVLDIAVDADLSDVPADVRRHKIRRGSGAIHLEDALDRRECIDALHAGAAVAAEEIDAGADLLIGGDMGIGNTTPAAAVVAATLGLPASQVVGRGTGVGDEALTHKEAVIDAALARVDAAHGDAASSDAADVAITTLTTVGSADIAAGVGYLIGAVRGRTPVLLDGLISVAEALVAEELCPGAIQWFCAGHRSTEPAQSFALEKLGLEPLLDLGMRLGEGSGAVAAVPLIRSAATLLAETGLLEDLG